MATQTKMLSKSSLNLEDSVRADVADILRQQLANLTDLVSLCLEGHWNTRGAHFYSRHKLFEELFGMLQEHVDVTAERIGVLGGFAPGSSRKTAAATQLEDLPGDAGADYDYLVALRERFTAFANGVRTALHQVDALGDEGTADLLTALSRTADKALWFLDAHQ